VFCADCPQHAGELPATERIEQLNAAVSAATAQALRAEVEVERLRGGLLAIGTECAGYVLGDCWTHGHTQDAEYTADRACDQCIASRALKSGDITEGEAERSRAADAGEDWADHLSGL
jgi:hypothetical protein